MRGMEPLRDAAFCANRQGLELVTPLQLGTSIVRLALLLLLVVGCAAADGVDEATPPDAGVVGADAAAKADSPAGCGVQLAEPTGITRGHAGGTGGGKGPIIACDDTVNERMIGVAMRMSNGVTSFNGRSAHGIGVACARVTIGATGAEVGAVKMIEVSGNGVGNWAPSTWTPVTSCKPGWVMSGIRVHTGVDLNRLLDVSIVCSKLGADAAPGTTEMLKVTGSLTDANGLDDVKCAAGEVLAQIGSWTGAGIDALDLSCSKPSCRM